MTRSIRTKLFWGISSLIIFFVLLSVLLNFNLLARYHISQKGKALYGEYLYIDQIYKGKSDDLLPHIDKMIHDSGTMFIILDKSFRIKYVFSPRPPGLPSQPKPDGFRVPPFIYETTDWSKPAYYIDKDLSHRSRNFEFLNFTATLHNGEHLWMGTPLPEIRQSVAIANRFFLLTGILTLIIGGIFALFYTKRFTEPILKLNAIAQNMVKLDFSKMYPVKIGDEIGQLGASINSLSQQLGKSIHDLQEANRQLQLDNERQKRVDEIRKEFISNVSHELKTPIALIQGYAEGLKLNVIENEQDKNFYCDVITDEITKMNKLVRNLLDLSEIDSGFLQLDKERFDLTQLTEDVLDKYHFMIKDKGITLQMEKSEAVFVFADIYRIEQVLVNYINNALDHIQGEKILKVTVRAQDGQAKFTLFNSGNPIPEEALDKIWYSFYKVDRARTRSYGGTGLGLSIVRAIIEQHQGAYGVANVPGGVEFRFQLPQGTGS